jgi:hypothetical protein
VYDLGAINLARTVGAINLARTFLEFERAPLPTCQWKRRSFGLTISGLKENTFPPEDSKRRRYVNDQHSGMCEM